MVVLCDQWSTAVKVGCHKASDLLRKLGSQSSHLPLPKGVCGPRWQRWFEGMQNWLRYHAKKESLSLQDRYTQTIVVALNATKLRVYSSWHCRQTVTIMMNLICCACSVQRRKSCCTIIFASKSSTSIRTRSNHQPPLWSGPARQ